VARARHRAGGPPEEPRHAASVDEAPQEPWEPRHAPPSEDTATAAPEERKEHHGVWGFFRELPGLILIAFALALVIKTFLVQAFYIPSQSMVPTLEIGDRVLVNKLIYDFGGPQRGDIIVFENPNLHEPDRNPFADAWNWLIEGLGFSTNPQKDFIKRVVGLPGETIEVKQGEVFINGQAVDEPYVGQESVDDYPPTKVEEDRVFVMGDNRPNSQDSRSSLGQIPLDKVVGKAFVLLWPPSRIEWLSDD
jgi:signal peptidase I